VRSPAGLLHPRNPRAVTFSLDLTAEPAGSRLMLLAVVASGVDPAAFTGATIPDLVLVSHGVAARSVCLT
jgi:microcompartment protein CcmK/EutM